MKLLSCHITGFGSFVNYDLAFDKGLNVVFQPNGWGKTTISAFIEAMLYGFPRKRIHDVRENKRLRYAPWSGGRYGGSLDLEYRGHHYRIKRSFGKTAAKDTAAVIDADTGRAVKVEASSIGEWLLGLDAPAFQRSVFIGYDGIDFDGPVAGLRNRLNALVGEAEDAPSFDQALSALEDRRRYYQKTGNRGRIAQIDQAIDNLLKRRKELEALVRQTVELQVQREQLMKDLRLLDEQLTAVQKDLEGTRKDERELAALVEVRKTLAEHKRESESALVLFRQQMPHELGNTDIEELIREVEEIASLEAEISNADEQLNELDGQIGRIKLRYGGSIPTKGDLEARAAQISDLRQAQTSLNSLLTDVESQPWVAIMAANPAAVSEARLLVNNWSNAEASIRKSERMKSEADAAEKTWTVARGHVLEAKAALDDIKASVPGDLDETSAQLGGVLEELRECLRIKEQLDVETSVLKARIETMDGTSGRVEITEADLARIDRLIGEVRSASDATVPLRQEADVLTRKTQELKHQRDDAQEAILELRANVANVELQRATAVREEADARSVREAARRGGNGTPFAGVAIIAMGLAFGVAGALVFMPLLVVSAILIVLGALAIKGTSNETVGVAAADASVQQTVARLEERENAWRESQDELRDAEARLEHIELEYQDAVRASALATEALAESLVIEHDSQRALAHEVNSLLSGRELDVDVVMSQIDSLRELLATSADAGNELAELRISLANLEKASQANEERARTACECVGIVTTGDISDDIEAVNAMLHGLLSVKNQLAQAQDNLDKALAAISSYEGVDDKGLGLSEVLSRAHSPHSIKLLTGMSKEDEKLKRYGVKLSSALSQFDLESAHDLHVDVERLRVALSAFDANQRDWTAREQRIIRMREQVQGLTDDLKLWMNSLGLEVEDSFNNETLGSLRADVTLADRLQWESSRISARKEVTSKQVNELREGVRSKLNACGVDQSMSIQEAAETLSQRASTLSNLKKAVDATTEDFNAWEKVNGRRLETLRSAMREGEMMRGERTAESIQKSREGIMAQLAQCDERREAYSREAEEYPKVMQRIAMLAQEKQEAVSNLATVQRSMNYLKQARERIDNRYLSGLVSRFNEYSEAWLGEDMDLNVNGELEVVVSEHNKSHDLAYYSTGYREVLGVCLRMALVDTIFDEDDPFLVMDDPFVNLDQRNLSRALSVLHSLSQNRQIIYFTCHPSRVDAEGAGEEKTEFVLPRRREQLESSRARAKREAEERAAKQAALVAAYHVVPVTQGRASIELADNRRVINNNIFNLAFAVQNDSGRRDNAFEAYFIDQHGRALCEKMSIEVRDGHVVPETLRFRLVTSDDDGNTYELFIHERGRGQTELVSRTLFHTEVAFRSEDFGF